MRRIGGGSGGTGAFRPRITNRKGLSADRQCCGKGRNLRGLRRVLAPRIPHVCFAPIASSIALCRPKPVRRYCASNTATTDLKVAPKASTKWRALLPVKTTSAHWLAHPAFASAVERFLERGAKALRATWKCWSAAIRSGRSGLTVAARETWSPDTGMSRIILEKWWCPMCYRSQLVAFSRESICSHSSCCFLPQF